MKYLLFLTITFSYFFILSASPEHVLYQGEISVDGQAYEGNLQMKLLLHNNSQSLWSHDSTGDLLTEPNTAIEVEVVDGLYSVALGDNTQTNMAPLGNSILGQSELYLRVWIDEGSGSFSLISPDKAFQSVFYAKSMVEGHIENSSANLSSLKVGSLEFLGTTGTAGQSLISQGDGTLVWGSPSIASAQITDGSIAAADLATLSSIDIDGGSIDGTPIGQNIVSSANFSAITVVDGSDTVIHTSGNKIGIGTEATSYRLTLPNEAGTGGMAIAYTWVTYSSGRYKENVKEIKGALEKIQKLRGVHYDSKPEYGGRNQIGFIAEEVGEVLPEVVQFEKNGKQASGMDYSRLPALTIQAIKELAEREQKQNEKLRAENEALKQRLDRLEKLLLQPTK